MTEQQARAHLDQVRRLIGEKKFDQAEQTLKSLDAQKDRLPESIRQQLSSVREELNQAKQQGSQQPPAHAQPAPQQPAEQPHQQPAQP